MPSDQIVISGNTVIDAIRQVAAMHFDPGETLADLPIGQKSLILVTAHRRESFGRALEQIFLALKEIALDNAGIHIVPGTLESQCLGTGAQDPGEGAQHLPAAASGLPPSGIPHEAGLSGPHRLRRHSGRGPGVGSAGAGA